MQNLRLAGVLTLCTLALAASPATASSSQGRSAAPPEDLLAQLFPYTARAIYGGFDPTFPVAPGGPWDAVACSNNGYSLTNGAVDASSGLTDDGVVVGRFEVHRGDRGSADNGGDRCELGIRNRKLLGEKPYLVSGGTADQGTPRFYHLSFGVGPDFPASGGYTVFAQWHQPRVPGPSPLSVETLGEDNADTIVVLRQIVNGKPLRPQALVQFPTPRGRWADLVVKLELSQRPELGYVKLWLDGRRVPEASSPNGVVDGTDDDSFRGATLYSAARGVVDWGLDFKLGNYRGRDNFEPSTVYHRLTTIATTKAAARSPVPVAPPPGVSCVIGNLPARPAVGQVYRPVVRLTNDAGEAIAGAPALVRANVETADAAGVRSGRSSQDVTITMPPFGGAVTYDLPEYAVPAGTDAATYVTFSAAAADGSFTCSSRQIKLPAATPATG